MSKLLLVVVLLGAFLIRVLPQWDKVFVNGNVWFREVDPWYHARLALVKLHNFPTHLRYDYYSSPDAFPPVGYTPLLSLIMSTPAKLLDKSERFLEVWSVLLPPIFAILTLLVLYLLCNHLFKSKMLALLAIILASFLPSEFLHRTLLGFTDHHMLEVFFSLLTIYFIVLLEEKQSYRYAILAGISLFLYFYSWPGGLLLLSSLLIYFLIRFYQKYLTHKPIDFLCKSTSLMFLVAFLLYLPELPFSLGGQPLPNILSMPASILIPLTLYLSTRLISSYKMCLPTTLGLILIGGVILFWALPVKAYILMVFRPGTSSIISEAALTTLPKAFSSYGLSFILGLVGLAYWLKRKQNLLIGLWGVIIFIAVLAQVRYGYYFILPLSIFTAYSISALGRKVSPHLRTTVAVMVMAFVLMGSLNNMVTMVSWRNTVTQEWYDALTWLRYNTPESFGNPNSFYSINSGKASYQVLSWWDYGNWVTYIGRRVPMSNPMGWGPSEISKFYVAQTTSEASKAISVLNIKYVIVDEEILGGKFYAMVRLAGYGEEKVERLRYNSMTWRLWRGENTGYKAIYGNSKIRIFEVPK